MSSVAANALGNTQACGAVDEEGACYKPVHLPTPSRQILLFSCESAPRSFGPGPGIGLAWLG
jgi:hypothetical protein